MVVGWAIVDSAGGAGGGGEEEFVRDVVVESMRSSCCSADFDLLLPRREVDKSSNESVTEPTVDRTELASSPSRLPEPRPHTTGYDAILTAEARRRQHLLRSA